MTNDINIKLKVLLDTANLISNTKKQKELLETELNKSPIQMRIESNTGIARQQLNELSKVMGISTDTITKNNSELAKLFNRYYATSSNVSDLAKNVSKLNPAMTNLNKVTEQINKNTNSVKFSSGSLNANSAKESVKVFEDLFSKSNLATSSMSDTERQAYKLNPAMGKVSDSTKKAKNSMSDLSKEAEKTGQSFSNIAGKILQWTALTTLVFLPIHSIQNGIKTIYDLDTAITDLKKVADELGTSVGIKDFTQQMNQMAIDVGHSTKDAIDAVAEFKRTGFSLSDSETLAKQAMIYSNIGDVDIAESTKSIISTLKGFNMTAEDTIHIMDAYNEVGNNFSISSEGIGSALQRSSSALYEANNSLEESIGLIVAGNASIQNPEKVGNGLNIRTLVA